MNLLLSLRNRGCGQGTGLKAVIVLLTVAFVLTLPATLFAFWPFAEPGKEWQAARNVQPRVPTVNEAEALKRLVAHMAQELMVNLADPDPEVGMLADGMIVCTFVDLKKLTRTSSFGRYIAEQLMNEFQKKSYTVAEIRKSQSVLIQQKRGEYGLSRDPEEISGSVTAGAMLTGTYTQTDAGIIVNAKIIDNRTTTLLSSATVVFPRNRLSNTLLADSSSAVTKLPEPVYMKRLEM